MTTRRWDVIIAGAGPGGSAAAIALAERGVSVLVLDKDEFPRFHIGESLLPASEVLVTHLGVDPDPNIFLFKRGARFICEASGRSQGFDFNEALPGPQRHAWHVDRARFDTLLRDRAREAGAKIEHGHRVRDLEVASEGVCVRSDQGTFRARYFVDATGQGRFLASKMRTGRPYRHFGKAAAFTHFSELSDDAREAIGSGNDIRIMMVPNGWAWIIPLVGRRLSVGLVSRSQGISSADLDGYLASSPLLERLTRGALRGETRLVGNFSFKNREPSGSRFTCIGDAACFIDPVFSSGVSLAVRGALATAERLHAALERGEEDEPRLMACVAAELERGYDTFAALVYRFYNTRFVDNMIFGAPSDGPYRAGVISVLAGDVFRCDNAFQDMLLASRRHPFREEAPEDASAAGSLELPSR